MNEQNKRFNQTNDAVERMTRSAIEIVSATSKVSQDISLLVGQDELARKESANTQPFPNA